MKQLIVMEVWHNIRWGAKYYVKNAGYSASGVETILKLTDKYSLVYFDGHTEEVSGLYVLGCYEGSGTYTTASKECD
jgi:hypothetical protein